MKNIHSQTDNNCDSGFSMIAWNRIKRVSALTFVASSTNGTGWNGSGSGTVKVEESNDDILTYTESGSWKSAADQQFKFSNVYRWFRLEEENTLRLEHLRFGEMNPVYLFDLGSVDGFNWCSTEPHVCREDLYSATLTIHENQMELKWTVQGPQKDEVIHYWYT